MPPRQSARVRARAGRVEALRRHHPPGAIIAQRAAYDFLRAAGVVGVGGVDEVDAGFASLADDAVRVRVFVANRGE